MKALDKVKNLKTKRRTSFYSYIFFLVAHTGYINAQFIRTKVVLLSEDMLTVTWYALHHTSLFKRCRF
jgi:hypothetical protein